MATWVANGTPGTTSATLPAGTATGDWVVVHAYRSGSTTAPTLAAGWTSIISAGANANSATVAYRQYDGVWTMPTWTNANRCDSTTVRPASGKQLMVGASLGEGRNNSNAVWSTVAMQVNDGTSVVFRGVSHTRPDALIAAPSAHTLISNNGTQPGYMTSRKNTTTDMNTVTVTISRNTTMYLVQSEIRDFLPPTYTQAAYRFYADGSESASTALAAQDTAPSTDVFLGDANLQLRVRLQNTNTAGGLATDDYQLQYDKNASGSWTTVTTGTTNVAAFASANLTDAAATTNRLGAGTGSFTAGEISETGTVTDLQIPTDAYTELLYSLSLKSANLAHGDVLTFRVLYNGAVTGMTYTATPTVNVTKVAPAITQAAYRLYADGTESGSTALAAQDTAYTADVSTSDVDLQLRTLLQSTSAAALPSTDDWQLQYEKNASGTWTNVASTYSRIDGLPLPTDVVSSYGSSTGNTGAGQSFTGNGTPLRRAWFSMRRSPTAAHSITAQVFAHTGTFGTNGSPTGAALATSTAISASALSTTQQDVYFDFDGTFTPVNGTNYVMALVIPAGPDGAYIDVHYHSVNTRHAGNRSIRSNAGTWVSSGSGDLVFGVYSLTAPAPTTVLGYDSPNVYDGEVTTSRLTGGSGTFTSGKVSEDGVVDDLGFTGNNHTELLHPIRLKSADLANGDTLRFRVLYNNATTYMTYTVTPTINVVKVALSVAQAAYRFYLPGTESGSTPAVAQDTVAAGDLDSGDIDATLRLRLQNANSGTFPSTDDWRLQWDRNGENSWRDVSTSPVLTQLYDTSNHSSAGLLGVTGSTLEIGQSFVGRGEKITRASFYLARLGTPGAGNVTCAVYQLGGGTFGTNGVPANPPVALATSTTSIAASAVSDTRVWVDFDFDGTFTLLPDVQYFVVLRCPAVGSTSNCISVGSDATSPTHYGNTATRAAAGTWTGDSSNDYIFRVYGNDSVVAYDDPSLTDDQATTNRLTGGTGTFEAGKVSEDGLVADQGIGGNNFTELAYTFRITPAALAESGFVNFRVVRNDSPSVLTYSSVPIVTLNKTVADQSVTLNVTDGRDTLAATVPPPTTECYFGYEEPVSIHRGTNSARLDGTAEIWQPKLLAPARTGFGTGTYTLTAVAGPTSGQEFQSSDGVGSTSLEWITYPLATDVTINNTIECSIRAMSTGGGNGAVNVVLEKLSPNMTVGPEIGRSTNTTPVGTTNTAPQTFNITPTSTALVKGDRIRARIYMDDSSGGNITASQFQLGVGGTSAGSSFDTSIKFNNLFSFESTAPAGTILYLTDLTGPEAGANTEKEMWTSRGAGSISAVKTIPAGWAAPSIWTYSGTAVEWYSRPLQAFTLSGLIRTNIRALSATGVTAMGVEIAVTDGDGANPVVVTYSAVHNASDLAAAGGVIVGGANSGGALPTTDTAIRSWVGGAPVSVQNGQRLRFRVYADDLSHKPMGGANTATVTYGGTTANAAGDSWIQLSQTVAEVTYPKIETLVDTFDAAVDTTTTWPFSANVSWDAGRAKILSNSNYDGKLVSSLGYDLAGSSVFAKVVRSASPPAETETYMKVKIGSVTVGDYLAFYLTGTTLTAERRLGLPIDTVATATYSATNHAWWKISEAGGTTSWHTSADGVTWNLFASESTVVATSPVCLYFDTGGDTTPNNAFIDNVNSTGAITGTLTSTDGTDTLSATVSAGPGVPEATLAVTDGLDTISAAGVLVPSATLSQTDGTDTLSAAVTFVYSSTLTATDGRDTISAAGVFVPSATLAQTDGRDTISSSGTYLAPSTLTATDGRDTISTTTSMECSATLTATDGIDVIASTAVFISASSLVATDGVDTLVATGTATTAAPTGERSLENDTDLRTTEAGDARQLESVTAIPTTGLVGWYDADDASTFSYSSGAVVSEWRDKSGDGLHFAQSTTSLQPSRTGTQNGRTTVAFDGSDDYMDTASATVAQPITVFLALNPTTATSQGWFSSVGGGFQIYVGGGSLYIYCGTTPSGLTVTSSYSGAHVWTFVANGSSTSARKDGTTLATGDTGTNGTTTGFRLAERNLTAGYRMTGSLFEMVVYDRVLTGPEVTQVESYLQTKWISGAPPSNSGTIAQTDGRDTISAAASATPPADATLAQTDGQDIFAGAAVYLSPASITVTDGRDTLTATVSTIAPEFTSTLARTDGLDTLSSVVFTAPTSTSTLARTDGLDTIATVVQTIPPDFTSTLTQTDGRDTLSSAVQTIAPEFTSTLAQTDGRDTLTSVVFTAPTSPSTLAQTDGRDTITTTVSTLVPEFTSTLALTDGRDLFAATGAVQVTSSLALTDGIDTIVTAVQTIAPNFTSALAVTDGIDTIQAIVAAITQGDSFIAVIDGRDTIATTVQHIAPNFTSTLARTDGLDTIATTVSAVGPATATLAVTDGLDLFAGAAAVQVVSSIAQTDGRDTIVTTVQHIAPNFTSTLARTDGIDTIAAVGVAAPPGAGTLVATDGRDTIAAAVSAAPTFTSTFAQTDGIDTLAAAVQAIAPNFTSTLAQTDGRDLFAGAATYIAQSSLALTDGRDTIATVVQHIAPNFTSTVAQTDGRDTLTSAVSAIPPPNPSTLAVTDGRDTMAAVAPSGGSDATLSRTDGRDTLAAAVSTIAPTFTSTLTATDGRDTLTAGGVFVPAPMSNGQGTVLVTWATSAQGRRVPKGQGTVIVNWDVDGAGPEPIGVVVLPTSRVYYDGHAVGAIYRGTVKLWEPV